MGLYTKLPEDLQEVDVIIAGGTCNDERCARRTRTLD